MIALAFLLSSCKSFDPAFLNPSGDPFNPKLPAMEAQVENNLVAIINSSGQTVGASPQDVQTLWNREAAEIITDAYSDKQGYLLLKVNTIETKGNFLYPILSGLTLWTINLFGVPTMGGKSTVEVQIDVMDLNRKLIGSYRASATKKMHTGMFSKTNYKEFPRVLYLLTVKEAIQEAKKKMQPDLDRLTKQLGKK